MKPYIVIDHVKMIVLRAIAGIILVINIKMLFICTLLSSWAQVVAYRSNSLFFGLTTLLTVAKARARDRIVSVTTLLTANNVCLSQHFHFAPLVY